MVCEYGMDRMQKVNVKKSGEKWGRYSSTKSESGENKPWLQPVMNEWMEMKEQTFEAFEYLLIWFSAFARLVNMSL